MDKNKIITSNINDTALIFEGGGMRASYKGTVPERNCARHEVI